MDPQQPLLLSSLRTFESIIEPILSMLSPSRICEIGVDKGIFTTFLANFCQANDCHYTGIDPSLSEAATQEPAGEKITFLKSPSLQALKHLAPQSVYFVDGDHNFYTVLNELRLIFSHSENYPVVFLHDVGWPWGRRDQYCSPENIPPEFRHPFSSTKGAAPGFAELQDWGFSGKGSDYDYGAAITEGGPRNGVLTAVENAIHELNIAHYRLLVVPIVFGLGILYDPKQIPRAVLAFLDDISRAIEHLNPLLVTLEKNRIDLFLNYLKISQHDCSLLARYCDLEKHSKDLMDRYKELADHSNALQGHYESLSGHARDLQTTCDALAGKLKQTEHDRAFLEKQIKLIKRPWLYFARDQRNHPPPSSPQ